MKIGTILPTLALRRRRTTDRSSACKQQSRNDRTASTETGCAEDAQIEQGVQTLLRHELTAERAVQVALLNNRELQARFEEIGIAQADVIQAGLISNPNFAGSFRFPDRPPSGTNIEYSIAQNFLDLLVLPLRKRIAAAQLAQTETHVADESAETGGGSEGRLLHGAGAATIARPVACHLRDERDRGRI
jgi:outer membrane protein TolC